MRRDRPSPPRLLLAALLVAAALVVAPARAADSEGRFAVKGAGVASCGKFVDLRAEKSKSVFVFVGWLQGYLSAFNQFTDDTYDVVSWERTEILLRAIERYCEKNRDQKFYAAAAGLANSLMPTRLKTVSERVKATSGKESVTVYREVLRRAQVALADRGFYFGEADGLFGPNTRVGIEAFQRAEKIKVTGLPDQITLLRLLP